MSSVDFKAKAHEFWHKNLSGITLTDKSTNDYLQEMTESFLRQFYNETRNATLEEAVTEVEAMIKIAKEMSAVDPIRGKRLVLAYEGVVSQVRSLKRNDL